MATIVEEERIVANEDGDGALDSVAEQCSAGKVSEEGSGEDQEEGELSEKEEVSEEGKFEERDGDGDGDGDGDEDGEVGGGVPLLKRRVTLDDLSGRVSMGPRGRDDFIKRGGVQSQGRDDDENVWLRDKMGFRPPATPYGPNLYNFAWAQAVQGGEGFKLVDKEGGDDETEEFQDAEQSFEEQDELEDELPESMATVSLKLPEGYDMRQVLYDRRMRSTSWNLSRGKPRRERKWTELEENVDALRKFDRDDRENGRSRKFSRRPTRSPPRRRDGTVSLRRERTDGDSEREKGTEHDRALEAERHRTRDRERANEKARERSDRLESSHRPSSSDDSDESRRSGPSTANGSRLHSGDSIAEVREEGEIEEGEIELPFDTPRSRSASRENGEDARAISPIEEGFSNGNLKKPLSSRLSFRTTSSHPRSLSRESSFRRLQDDDLRHRLTRDAERERAREDMKLREDRREQVARLTGMMKSLTVKDAQKSLINTCLRLDNAMRLLRELSKQRIPPSLIPPDEVPPDVSKLATKAFQGLRAVYAVWNTASGRGAGKGQRHLSKLFTPKQARELEEFMDQVTKIARRSRMEGGGRQIQAASKSAESTQEIEVRHRELSANAPVSNSLNPKTAYGGTGILVESPEHKLSFDNGTDTKDAIAEAAIAAAALAYAQSSAAALASFSQGSTYSQPVKDQLTVELSQWGWNGLSDHYEQSMSPGLPPGYSGGSHARALPAQGIVRQLNGTLNLHGVPLSTSINGWANVTKKSSHDLKGPYGPGYLEEDWEELSPPSSHFSGYTIATRKIVKLDERGFPISSSETINTFPPLNKLDNLPVSNLRLPSPTPSEEDDAHVDQVMRSSKPVANEKTQLGQKPFLPLPKASSTLPTIAKPFYKSLNTHVDETGRAHYASSLLVPSTSADPDLSLNFEQPKSQTGCGPLMSSIRNRDPRKQLQNGYLELEIPQQQPVAQVKYPWPSTAQILNRKREGEDYLADVEALKRLKMSGASNEVVNSDSSVGAFALGGWLEEGAVSLSGQEDNGVEAMDIDLDSPTPPSRKQLSNDELLGTCTRKREVSSGIVSSELVDSVVAASTWPKEPSDHVDSSLTKQEGQAGDEDAARHRMRPRDPRRVLLETTTEIVRVNHKNSPVRETSVSGTASWYRQQSPGQCREQSPTPASVPESFNIPLTFKTLGQLKDQREGGDNNNEMKHITGGTSLVRELATSELKNLASNEDTILSEKEGGRDGDSNQASEGYDEPSEEPIPGDDADHLGPWDPLLRKPRFGPSHWGGKDMHRDFEQLLGDLDEVQRLAIQNERQRRMQEQDRMFSAGKLCLVLDLDHTLLNSAKFVEIEPDWEARLRGAENMERSRASRDGHTKQELYRFPHMGMWTKLRPGIWKFLAKASELYELHVYTMGNKAYATEMAKLLDPTGSLFAGRVISKGDEVDAVDSDDRPPKSKDLDGVLGMESAVVIIDDSSRVWPHHRENLIVVERYMYFPSSRRQFGLPGPSLLEVGHDERAADGMLSAALAVIEKIHSSFFNNKRLREVDVRSILAAEQHRVLAGCCVLFSRIFPVGETNPHLHPLWRLAEQFGASCCLNINDKVTHVVAISLGTDKVNWASATGRPVVRPAWLEASAILYRRANEQDFPVPP